MIGHLSGPDTCTFKLRIAFPAARVMLTMVWLFTLFSRVQVYVPQVRVD
jgi:hypothetical protein